MLRRRSPNDEAGTVMGGVGRNRGEKHVPILAPLGCVQVGKPRPDCDSEAMAGDYGGRTRRGLKRSVHRLARDELRG